jgi:di/tricarboxylate transporter
MDLWRAEIFESVEQHSLPAISNTNVKVVRYGRLKSPSIDERVHNVPTKLDHVSVKLSEASQPEATQQAPLQRRPNEVKRVLAECVLGLHASCVNQTVRNFKFRAAYESAILAIHRRGELLKDSIGETVLRGGDTLLLETSMVAARRLQHHDDFVFFHILDEQSTTKSNVKLAICASLISSLIIMNTVEDKTGVPLPTSALLCICALYLAGLLDATSIREAIPGKLLLAVTAAFGIAKAMESTGVAQLCADSILAAVGSSGLGTLFAVYLVTVLLTALLSNGAAVALVFPVAADMARRSSISLKPFAMLIAIAASSDFATPIGYQTNLMVSGPGGYQFLDYTRFGVPLQIVCMMVAVPLGYWLWWTPYIYSD